MAEDTQDPPEDPKDQADPPEDPKDQDPPEGGDQDPEKDPKDPKKDQDPEVKRAIARRDRALKRAQDLEAQVAALKDKYEPEKADPVKVANRRLVTAESRVVMTAAGITDAADQKTLAAYLDLDSVAVEEDGTVDSAAIQERLEDLVAIVGKVARKGQTRVPRVNPTDRAGDKAPVKDAAAARRRAMLLGR